MCVLCLKLTPPPKTTHTATCCPYKTLFHSSEPRKRRPPAREAAKTTIRQPKHVARSIVHTFMSFSDVFPLSREFPSYFFYFFFVHVAPDRKSTRLTSSH